MGKNARLRRERKAQRDLEHSVPESSPIQRSEESTDARHRSFSPLQQLVCAPTLHIIFIMVLCVSTAIFPIESEDIFSNIVTGELLWTTRSIPTTDPFSFTGPHQWLLNRPLPSLVFFCVHSLGGLPAIQLFCALIFGCAYVITYLVWSRRTSMSLVAFAAITLAIFASCYWFQTRIYVFAYLFTAVTLLLITSDRSRVIVWAIPIQILWINSHPSALLGTALIGFWWLITTWRTKQFALFPTTIALGVLIANLLSPAGFRSYLKFADEIFGDHPSRSNIYEWFSPFHPLITSQHLAWWFYCALALFIVVLGFQFLQTGKIRAAMPLIPISIILCLMSIGSARHAPLFYLSFAGLLICTSERYWKSLSPSRRENYLRRRTAAGIALVCISLGTALKVIFFGYANGDVERRFAFGIDTRKFPERPTQILRDAQVGGNIFSDYGSGSYFLYRMYPRYKVYIDSARLDEVYGEEGFRRYIQFGNDVQLINREIKKYDIRSFILPLPASESDIVQIYRFLSSDQAWRLAFFDDGHMIFITESEAKARNIPTYQTLSPFMETGKVLKERPEAATELQRDFELGSQVNPDSIAFLTMKAHFHKAQSQSVDLNSTLDRLAGVCDRRDPSAGCRAMAAQQLNRFGRFKQARDLLSRGIL